MTHLFSWRPRATLPPKPPPVSHGGPVHLDGARWMQQLFASQMAQQGGVVRRKLRDVDRIVGRDAFVAELRRRGYRAMINGAHIVIFCNRDTLDLLE